MARKNENRGADTLIKFIIFLVTAWMSVRYADGYKIVGPVFGLAVVAFDSNLFRKVSKEKHILFIIASTLIYGLVYWISMWKWEADFVLINYFIGPFPLGVILGSVLLPLAHRKILTSSPALTKQVMVSLVASFYMVMILAFLNNEYGVGIRFNFIAISITLWQAIYLYLFFRP